MFIEEYTLSKYSLRSPFDTIALHLFQKRASEQDYKMLKHAQIEKLK